MTKTPVSIIMNTHSGHHQQGHGQMVQYITTQLQQAGFEVQLYLVDATYDLNRCIEDAVRKHKALPQQQQGIIAAAGGDGTINAVVQALLHSHIELAILPFGTFNYVARALDIPLTLEAAVQNIIDGKPKAIHLGQVNGRIYLNNASLGLYPVIIERREAYNKKFGRFPFIAYLSGLDVLLKQYSHYKLQATVDGQLYPIATPLIFFGNNQLQLQDLKLRLAECAAQGKLAGVAVGKVKRWQVFQLILKLLQGELENADHAYGFCADSVEIVSKHANMKVALDGEIIQLETPLKFSVIHEAVRVRAP